MGVGRDLKAARPRGRGGGPLTQTVKHNKHAADVQRAAAAAVPELEPVELFPEASPRIPAPVGSGGQASAAARRPAEEMLRLEMFVFSPRLWWWPEETCNHAHFSSSFPSLSLLSLSPSLTHSQEIPGGELKEGQFLHHHCPLEGM